MLDREIADFVLAPLMQELVDEVRDLPYVVGRMNALREEILAHLENFRSGDQPEPPSPLAALARQGSGEPVLDRYQVNVFIENSTTAGAPIVVERSPTYYNLTGRIDYRTAFGTMVTDSHHIKAGALHRANGGRVHSPPWCGTT